VTEALQPTVERHQPSKAQICPLCVAPTMAIASVIADQNGGTVRAALDGG
jgi:hypothetical protein